MSYKGIFLLGASLLLAAPGLLVGCGGSASHGGGEGADSLQVRGIMDLADPAAPIPVDQFLVAENALIGPGDEIRIELLGHSEVTGNYLVTRNGKINLPLLGSVDVAGKSIDSLDVEITRGLSEYYRFTDVSVNMLSSAPRSVFVLGEVEKPGRYDIETGDRILHGLATAGGMSRQARSDNIVLMRRMPDGKEHAYRLAFNHLHSGIYPQDIYLQPGDVIFVPRSRFFTFAEYANELLGVIGRTALTSLYIDSLVGVRTRALSIGTQ